MSTYYAQPSVRFYAQQEMSTYTGFPPVTYPSTGILCYQDSNTGMMMTYEQPGATHWSHKFAGQPTYSSQPRQCHYYQSQKNSAGLRPVTEKSISIGSVVQLPKPSRRGENPLTCLKTGKQLDYPGYGHPVVIIELKRNPATNKVVALCCIISGNPKPSPYDPAIGARLPIHSHTEAMGPRPAYIASTFREEDIMVLENRSMAKQSYILTGNVYAIPIEFLMSFSNDWDHRLGANSYMNLRRHLGLPDKQWIDTRICATGRAPEWEVGTFAPLTSSPKNAKKALSDAALREKQMERDVSFILLHRYDAF
ncbi:hypothetical protein ACMFMG_006050 [Clarireedia jacksonii]